MTSVASRFGLIEEGAHEGRQPLLVDGHGCPQIELQVEGHLVVAAAPGVDLSGHRPRYLGQSSLDGHVDVLVLEPPREDTRLHFAGDLGERAEKLVTLTLSDHPIAASMRTWAMDPATSKGASTWSKGMEAFIRSNRGRLVGREATAPRFAGAGRAGFGSAPAGSGLLVRIGEHLEQALVRGAPRLQPAGPTAR